MDILTHTFSGVAVATTIVGVSRISGKRKATLVVLGALAGAMPDIDAISLWSGFDKSFGNWLKLSDSGNEIYFSTFWYSHHAFMHSLLASVLFGLAMTLLVKKLFKNEKRFLLLPFLTFVLAYLSHLIGDLPTPASVWNGIALWWPSKVYIGGYGNIWWWNNYDIFLIIFEIGVLNIIYMLISGLIRKRARWIPLLIFGAGLSFAMYQINTRPFDFSYSGHTPKYSMYEEKSKEIQREILGEKLYKLMENFDNHLPFYF